MYVLLPHFRAVSSIDGCIVCVEIGKCNEHGYVRFRELAYSLDGSQGWRLATS